MSYSFKGSSDRNSRHRDGSLQKKREIEKLRRHQQFNTEETTVEPIFSQPRKKSPAERQDSLTRNIANVLGDPALVGGILFREPLIWLGTSRTEQGQASSGQKEKANTKSGMQSSTSEKSFTGSGDQRSMNYKTQSRAEGLTKSDHRQARKHIPRLKTPRPVNRPENSNYAPSHSTEKTPSYPSRSGNWSSYHDNTSRRTYQAPLKEDISALSSTVAAQERDRRSSADSDLINGIFKEMVDFPNRITEIKTPNVNENNFNFTPPPPKNIPEAAESSVDNDESDDGGTSDTGSSGSSDDEKEKNSWLLHDIIKKEEVSKISPKKENSSGGKPLKRKRSTASREQSPKIPHLKPADDKPYLSSAHQNSAPSKTNVSPRSKHPASVESNQRKPADSPSQHTNSRERSKLPSHGAPSHKRQPPSNSASRGRTRKDSVNLSSSSDGSSGDTSSDESEFNDDDPTTTSPQCNADIRQYPRSGDAPVPSRSRDLTPVRDKYDSAASHHPQASPNITVTPEMDGKNEKAMFPHLWVRIRASAIDLDLKKDHGLPYNDHFKRPTDKRHPPTNERPLVSVGSETEQPSRRTDKVEVAIAQPSDYGEVNISSGRKGVNEVRANQNKKSHRSDPHSKQHDYRSPFSVSGRRNSTSANIYEGASDANICQSSLPNGQDNSIKPSSPDLPDSSLPGEQERIETSDSYMRKGKRMKHEGDGMVDSRNGRTRQGEALTRALSYFEASLFFIMSGYVMENENPEDRLETSSQHSHSPANMYQQTLPLLDFVLKMRPRAEQEDNTFKQIMISCLRCQSFLYFRIFQLKRDTAVKNSEHLTKHFESMSKSAQTHSPWRNASAAPNVLSPMSPAVPSPFGHRGPSPASSNNSGQVSSSTQQAGKMTPTSHSNLPQKTYDLYRQHHAVMCNLLQAHEKWDLAESMLKDHADFFRNIDALSNITLTFHSSLRQVFLYYKTVLHQLRTLGTSSPST